MFAGRSLHPYAKVALIAALLFLVVTSLRTIAVLPIAIGLVVWGGYQIVRSERRRGPRRARPSKARANITAKRERTLPTVKAIRIDPDENLTVPKDWR